MKKNLLVLIVSLLSLTSCSNTDSRIRYIFLSARYCMESVAFSENGKIPGGPAHFNEFTDLEKCDDIFDKKNCFFTMHVKVENKKPFGYGTLDLSFIDKNIESKHYDFKYVVLYDKVYGGEPIQIDNTKPEILGRQHVRGNYWWYRSEIFLPELNNRRIIAEFKVAEKYDEPIEFDERYEK